MLKNFSNFALIFLIAIPAFTLNDGFVKDLRYKQLTIDAGSVILLSSQEITPGLVKALFSFKITPSNSCEENYAGAFEHSDGNFTIVYSYKLDQPCHFNAKPRVVNHIFYVSASSDPLKTSLAINGKTYNAINQ